MHRLGITRRDLVALVITRPKKMLSLLQSRMVMKSSNIAADPLAELAMEYAIESFSPNMDAEDHCLKRQNIIGFVGISQAIEAIDSAFETLKLLGLHK